MNFYLKKKVKVRNLKRNLIFNDFAVFKKKIKNFEKVFDFLNVYFHEIISKYLLKKIHFFSPFTTLQFKFPFFLEITKNLLFNNLLQWLTIKFSLSIYILKFFFIWIHIIIKQNVKFFVAVKNLLFFKFLVFLSKRNNVFIFSVIENYFNYK